MSEASRLVCTDYFLYTRNRPDRARIREEWIIRAIEKPVKTIVQSDGRYRKWAMIEEEGRYLRVVLLADGRTVHNAFFDRGFEET